MDRVLALQVMHNENKRAQNYVKNNKKGYDDHTLNTLLISDCSPILKEEYVCFIFTL
jgi:hypothetical protein